jgi:hypothetical protein
MIILEFFQLRSVIFYVHVSWKLSSVKMCNFLTYLFLTAEFVQVIFIAQIFTFAGNLGRVDYISDTEYDVFIRPDTCNPRFRVWFNFTVENVKADQRVIFNVVNFSKTKSLYRDGMTPIVKSTNRPKWYDFLERCPCLWDVLVTSGYALQWGSHCFTMTQLMAK